MKGSTSRQRRLGTMVTKFFILLRRMTAVTRRRARKLRPVQGIAPRRLELVQRRRAARDQVIREQLSWPLQRTL